MNRTLYNRFLSFVLLFVAALQSLATVLIVDANAVQKTNEQSAVAYSENSVSSIVTIQEENHEKLKGNHPLFFLKEASEEEMLESEGEHSLDAEFPQFTASKSSRVLSFAELELLIANAFVLHKQKKSPRVDLYDRHHSLKIPFV